MIINEHKLYQMKRAVIIAIGHLSQQQLELLDVELRPFCVEMTDEEIEKLSPNYGIERFLMYNEGFKHGAKSIRDGK